MTILTSPALENSSYSVTTVFIAPTGEGEITPKTLSWSLLNGAGEIVNWRDQIPLTPAASITVVVSGDDLALPDPKDRFRYVLFEATYDSPTYGNDLPLNLEYRFTITNLVGLPREPTWYKDFLGWIARLVSKVPLSGTEEVYINDGGTSKKTTTAAIALLAGGVTDHGALTGLSDDDHSQYHTDARGDARYAPIAQGVTNGDSHDHSSGDGAQIAYSGLSGLPTLGTAAATAITDYATAAQGSLADTAVQPADDAATLGSGIAGDGYVLTADGIGGSAWEAVAAGVTDHGALTGLSDDDHSQYHTDARGDARYAPLSLTINDQTGTTYTLVLTDSGKLIRANNAAAITLTVPPNSSVAFPVGTSVAVQQQGVGQVSIAAGAGVTINSRSSMSKISARYGGVSLVKTASPDTWWLEGALSA